MAFLHQTWFYITKKRTSNLPSKTAKFKTMHFRILGNLQLRSRWYLRHYIFCLVHINFVLMTGHVFISIQITLTLRKH